MPATVCLKSGGLTRFWAVGSGDPTAHLISRYIHNVKNPPQSGWGTQYYLKAAAGDAIILTLNQHFICSFIPDTLGSGVVLVAWKSVPGSLELPSVPASRLVRVRESESGSTRVSSSV